MKTKRLEKLSIRNLRPLALPKLEKVLQEMVASEREDEELHHRRKMAGVFYANGTHRKIA